MDIIAKLLIITFTLHETFIFASSANIRTVVLHTLFNKKKRKKEKKKKMSMLMLWRCPNIEMQICQLALSSLLDGR